MRLLIPFMVLGLAAYLAVLGWKAGTVFIVLLGVVVALVGVRMIDEP